VYYGTAPRRYEQGVGNGTYTTTINATISSLPPGFTYYFAVTAVDATGLESAYSGEVSKVIQN
jgi:fibronectin type 3 domain-containing protein